MSKKLRHLPVMPTALGVVLVVVVGILELKEAGARRAPEPGPGGFAAEEVHAARAWSTVHRCWLGAPLEYGEDIDARVRATSLVEAPSDREGAWPARCVKPLAGLIDALRPFEHLEAMSADLGRLKAEFEKGRPMPAAGLTLDTWRTRAARLDPLEEIEPAPAPKPALRIGHPYVSTSNRAGDVTQSWDGRVYFEGASAQRLCVVEPDGKRLACRHVPDAAASRSGPRLAGVAGPGPALLLPPYRDGAGDSLVIRGAEVVWRGKDYVLDASVEPGGSLRVVVGDGIKRSLVERAADGSATKKPLTSATNAFFDGHLLELGKRLRVHAAGGAAPIDVGPFWDPASIRLAAACHTDDAAFALFAGGTLVRRAGTQWSMTRMTEAPIRCEAGNATFAVAGRRQVERATCDAGGCATDAASLPDLPPESGARAATTCPGGAVMLVEASGGAVRAAVAPLRDITSAPRSLVAVTVDLRYGGGATHSAPIVVPVDGGAFVLAGARDGLLAARVGCDGAVTPVVAALE